MRTYLRRLRCLTGRHDWGRPVPANRPGFPGWTAQHCRTCGERVGLWAPSTPPWRTAQAIESEIIAKSTRLLEYALHLRMHGENAPGGSETWTQFDRDCEHFLRDFRPNAIKGGADRG